MYKQVIEQDKPPQGLHIPALYEPIVLSKEDADEFYAKLKEVRDALPEENKHFLKKDREIEDFISPQSSLIGIKNEFNNLVSGALVIMPITRLMAQKHVGYPFDAKGEQTAVLNALWTDANWLKRGFATAVIGKTIDLAKEAGMRYVLSGVADGNPSIGNFQKAGFKVFMSNISPYHGKLIHYMRREL